MESAVVALMSALAGCAQVKPFLPVALDMAPL